MKNAGNKSREKGHRLERADVNDLKSVFPDIGTSRNKSKKLDNAGVDIVGNIPFSWQCKAVERTINYHTLITDIEEKIKKLNVFKDVIIHHKRIKPNTHGFKEDKIIFRATAQEAFLQELILIIQNQETTKENKIGIIENNLVKIDYGIFLGKLRSYYTRDTGN